MVHNHFKERQKTPLRNKNTTKQQNRDTKRRGHVIALTRHKTTERCIAARKKTQNHQTLCFASMSTKSHSEVVEIQCMVSDIQHQQLTKKSHISMICGQSPLMIKGARWHQGEMCWDNMETEVQVEWTRVEVDGSSKHQLSPLRQVSASCETAKPNPVLQWLLAYLLDTFLPKTCSVQSFTLSSGSSSNPVREHRALGFTGSLMMKQECVGADSEKQLQ